MAETILDSYSSAVDRILTESAQELLGKELFYRYTAHYEAQEPFRLMNAGAFFRELEKAYGIPGGQGLALRIGQAMFRLSLQQYGEQAGFRSMEYRMMPSPRRVEAGLHSLGRMLSEAISGEVAVSDAGAYWKWQIETPLALQERPFPGPDCHMIAGFLQEFTSWAAGGRFYKISEIECRALGARACVFQIDKKPLD